MKQPLAIELFAGLHGWGEGLVAEGFRVVGFDIMDMCDYINVPRPDGIELVLQDVTTLHGSRFKDATVIVASPPCQAYSYRAMPWKRAKALPPPDNTLFEACFRIQREASDAAGHHIPMVVENVRGAQKWVGRAKWHYGSYYLWGDVPALMPMTQRANKVTGFRFDGSGKSFQTASVELTGQRSAQDGLGGYGGSFGWNNTPMRRGDSKSSGRKRASALIAKIPRELAQHIARCQLGF
jgi:hypothetical protein